MRILLTMSLVSAIFVAGLAAPKAPAADPPARVETIYARTVTGRLVAVTSEKVELQAGDKRRTLARRDVVEIVFAQADDLMAGENQIVIVTAGGGRIAVANLTVAEGFCSFDSPLLGKTRMLVSAAARIYMPTSRRTPAEIHKRYQAMKGRRDQATKDVLFVVQKDAWMAVRGVLKAMNAETITFAWKDTNRKIRRSTVPLIRLAGVGDKPPVTAGVLTGKCGSKLRFTTLTMLENSLTVKVPGLGELKIARGAVASIRFRSDRVVRLADLKPLRVVQRGFFDRAFGYRVNRSVGGRELRLGGKVFETGLGLHSFCELSFDVGGKYERFVAVVGIDDSVRPIGDAVVTFLGDGKKLIEPVRITGKSDPKVVRLRIGKVRELTVRVDFGLDKLDVGDHVNIVAARLIKK